MSGNTHSRTDVLNHLIERHNLKRFLEIGVQVPELNFDKINCEYKVGVDPDPNAKATFCMTSDEFFESYTEFGFVPFDIVFIDGLHTAEQVKKDFENSLRILSPNGYIVLHDCNPEKEEHTIVPRPTKTGHWNGDVYKLACNIWYQVKMTVDVDNGCCVLRPHASSVIYFTRNLDHLTWEKFDTNRKQYLNLISWDEFLKL